MVTLANHLEWAPSVPRTFEPCVAKEISCKKKSILLVCNSIFASRRKETANFYLPDQLLCCRTMLPIVLRVHRNDLPCKWIDILDGPIRFYHFYYWYRYQDECVYIAALRINKCITERSLWTSTVHVNILIGLILSFYRCARFNLRLLFKLQTRINQRAMCIISPVQFLSSIDFVKSMSSLKKSGTSDSSMVSQLGIVIGDDIVDDVVKDVGSHHPFGDLISTSTHSFSKPCRSPRGAE